MVMTHCYSMKFCDTSSIKPSDDECLLDVKMWWQKKNHQWVYTLYGSAVVIHHHHHHHHWQQQTMSHSRLVLSSCALVSPGQPMFLLLVEMYSYANLGMHHSFLMNVVSTCIYNPPQFNLNCTYLVLFKFYLWYYVIYILQLTSKLFSLLSQSFFQAFH